MSFLNSVLSSIGGAASAPSSNTANVSRTKPSTNTTILSNSKATTPGAKRSLDGDHSSQPPFKSARTEYQTTASALQSGAFRTASTAPQGNLSTGIVNAKPVSRAGTPSGTSKPSNQQSGVASSPAARNTTTTSASKPLVLRGPPPVASKSSSVPTTRTPMSTVEKPAFLNKPPAALASNTTTAKKGSYREIMERAQAAKATQAALGVITHKAVPKVSKKERLAQEAEAAQKAKLAARGRASPVKGDKPAGGGRTPFKSAEPIREKKAAPDLGYKGTMRPNSVEPVYKGTAKPVSASNVSKLNLLKRPPEKRLGGATDKRYAYYSDDEDEDEEESYLSDASEDMEAAGFAELDDEEEASLRQARKDDAEEKKLEDRLKEEKRKRLQALATATAARRARS